MTSIAHDTSVCSRPTDTAIFDAHVTEYESSLQKGLRLSGEGPEYFARHRIAWTERMIHKHGDSVGQILDYGCGIGLATTLLWRMVKPEIVWGYDPSARTIERARHEQRNQHSHFCSDPTMLPKGQFDLVYCNGVFHHIDPSERPGALAIVTKSLRPGGWFALWENNPWNPGTRLIMSQVEFDREAIVLSPPAARRMLRSSGFHVVRSDAWFIFPRMLHWLRPLEMLVHRIPLGGQYLTLARKPLEETVTTDAVP
jgi:SAM-dependent methyltransferase